MPSGFNYRPLSYSTLAAGCVLAVAAAIVPHYGAGHTLHAGVLLASLLPYLLLGSFTGLLRDGIQTLAGVIVLAVDLAVKIPQRFIDYDGYSNPVIFYVPVITALVLPILLVFGRREWAGPQPAAASAKAAASKAADGPPAAEKN